MYYAKVHQEASTNEEEEEEEEESCVLCTYQHLSKVSNYFVYTSSCVNLCQNYRLFLWSVQQEVQWKGLMDWV